MQWSANGQSWYPPRSSPYITVTSHSCPWNHRCIPGHTPRCFHTATPTTPPISCALLSLFSIEGKQGAERWNCFRKNHGQSWVVWLQHFSLHSPYQTGLSVLLNLMFLLLRVLGLGRFSTNIHSTIRFGTTLLFHESTLIKRRVRVGICRSWYALHTNYQAQVSKQTSPVLREAHNQRQTQNKGGFEQSWVWHQIRTKRGPFQSPGGRGHSTFCR